MFRMMLLDSVLFTSTIAFKPAVDVAEYTHVGANGFTHAHAGAGGAYSHGGFGHGAYAHRGYYGHGYGADAVVAGAATRFAFGAVASGAYAQLA